VSDFVFGGHDLLGAQVFSIRAPNGGTQNPIHILINLKYKLTLKLVRKTLTSTPVQHIWAAP
jgi:hypothetical protein